MAIIYLISLPIGIIALWVFVMWALPRIRVLHNARLRGVASALTSLFLILIHFGARDSTSIVARAFDSIVPDFLGPVIIVVFVASLIVAVLPPPPVAVAKKEVLQNSIKDQKNL